MTFRIGFVGLDHWYTGLGVLDAAVEHPDIEVVSIADAESDRLADAGRRSGVERLVSDWRAVVDDPSIDAIASFISVDQNPEVCIAAAQSGKHLMSIKPMARTLDEADGIVDAVRSAGVQFIPSECRQRLSDQTVQIKKWMREGRLGELISGSFALWAGLPQRWPGDDDHGWFLDPDRAPGGAWIDHSVYQLDLMRYLLNDEVASVVGQTANLIHTDIPFEDWGVATVKFRGGAQAVLEDTWTAPEGRFQQSANLVFSEGAVLVDGIRGKTQVIGRFDTFDGWAEGQSASGRSFALDHWIAAARGEQAPEATVEDAWNNLAVCTAFYESARTGRAVAPRTIEKKD